MRKVLLALAMCFLFTDSAFAYVGPSLGIGVIGAIFGILAAILFAIVGLIWYPVKRLMKKKGKTNGKASKEGAEPAGPVEP
jgi:hypothetical protein